MAEGGSTRQTVSLRCPTAQRGHVGFHPSLVNEDQPCRINTCLMPLPSGAPTFHIRALSLVSDQCLFLKLNPQPRRNRQTVSWLTSTPCSASIS